MSANNASARYSRTGGILSACRGEEARPLWGRKNSLRYSWRDNVKKGFPAFTVETARLAIVPPQWQTRENGFNFRVPAPSRGRRFYSLVPSPPPGVLPPSTRATPAIPLLECCRAHSFQLWSSASSPRIRWNELALRNRKASLHPPLLSNPSSPHLLSPPPLSFSLSLSRFHAREPLRFPFNFSPRSYARSNGMEPCRANEPVQRSCSRSFTKTRNMFLNIFLGWIIQPARTIRFRDGNNLDSNIVFDAAHRYGP